MKIHLIYPHKNINRTPDVIGFKLYKFLSNHFKVVLYEWDSFEKINPISGDILLGHLHPNPFTIMHRSFFNKKWSKRFILQPFNGNKYNLLNIDKYIHFSDGYFAISGKYWINSMHKSPYFKHWCYKTIHLELAIDPKNFRFLKKSFNRIGSRRILYIGNDNKNKNLSYLNSLARTLNINVDWIGNGLNKYSNLRKLGYFDFALTSNLKILSGYDFLITVGKNDANPTTVLEAMSWGIIPICSETSGYISNDGVLLLSSDDIFEASNELKKYLNYSSSYLLSLQKNNISKIKKYFNWNIFLNKIFNQIKSNKKNKSLTKTFKTSYSFTDSLLFYLFNIRSFLVSIVNNIRNKLR